MTRKELYNKVKELGVADAIKAKFGDNFTRISSANLEDFLKNFKEPKEIKKKSDSTENTVKDTIKEAKSTSNAIIKLLTILQTKRVITAKEAEEVAKEL